MSYEVNDIEFVKVDKLPESELYEYFVKKVADFEEIWSVRSGQGWTLMGTPHGREVVPVWPAKRFAQAQCLNEWKDCEAKVISLNDWLDKWVPGMIRDGRDVAVFPTSSSRGIVIHPSTVADSLREERTKYSDEGE